MLTVTLIHLKRQTSLIPQRSLPYTEIEKHMHTPFSSGRLSSGRCKSLPKGLRGETSGCPPNS